MKYKEGEFEFEDTDDEGTRVFFRRRPIGNIFSMVEPSGRYCYRLGCDGRRQPRTYRGKLRAARALKVIDVLKQTQQKEKLSLDEIIVRAWDEKPHSAPS